MTEDISSRILRLPFYNDLKAKEQKYVIEEISSFVKGKKALLST